MIKIAFYFERAETFLDFVRCSPGFVVRPPKDRVQPLSRHALFRTLRRLLTAFVLVCCSTLPGLAVAASRQPDAPAVLVIGDSLSAEYGLTRDTGWVRLLRDRMSEGGFDFNVVNASISGDTTSGGKSRLPALLEQHKPALVIIQLGGNDGLRGLPVASMRANLESMLDASKAAGARALLVGIRIPPNYGRDYTEQFFKQFAGVAKSRSVPLVPFLLEGFAEKPSMFQEDRIHPTEQAQPQMLENVWRQLKPMLIALRGR